MKETMTVHKALAELKILADRIQKEEGKIEFAVANKAASNKYNGAPVKEYIDNTVAAYKSLMTLINRRNAIKRAVTQSNAVQTVTIDGKSYTVAEAIDMKSVGLNPYRSLISHIDSNLSLARRKVNAENGDRLESRADDYVKSLYGSSEMKNMSDDVKKVRENFVESQMLTILDPIGCEKELKRLQDYVDNFLAEVDSALSVSNALTTIEVEYETV